ncbi:hypothetical protein FQN60_006338 [Etheostoma spectabile]|uniref:Protein kinase domain-containing protein n=1 Tax=Etheostoma spectabile TaxID=54343 RepID=A0A5J5CLU3_9PERO|nr:hypothetical protein FQN60_006338 [Etheostoma spectabile]
MAVKNFKRSQNSLFPTDKCRSGSSSSPCPSFTLVPNIAPCSSCSSSPNSCGACMSLSSAPFDLPWAPAEVDKNWNKESAESFPEPAVIPSIHRSVVLKGSGSVYVMAAGLFHLPSKSSCDLASAPPSVSAGLRLDPSPDSFTKSSRISFTDPGSTRRSRMCLSSHFSTRVLNARRDSRDSPGPLSPASERLDCVPSYLSTRGENALASAFQAVHEQPSGSTEDAVKNPGIRYLLLLLLPYLPVVAIGQIICPDNKLHTEYPLHGPVQRGQRSPQHPSTRKLIIHLWISFSASITSLTVHPLVLKSTSKVDRSANSKFRFLAAPESSEAVQLAPGFRSHKTTTRSLSDQSSTHAVMPQGDRRGRRAYFRLGAEVMASLMALSSCQAPIIVEDSSLEGWTVIGSGGFGQIYKARHRQWGCDVAIKLLHYDDGSSESLLREIDMMRQGSSPYAIQVRGVFRGRVPNSVLLAHQVALGLNFLHSLSPPILHLDLKPSNVLLDFYLNAKLTDFGLARYYHSVTRVSKKNSGEEGGTISYMPPEAFHVSYKPTLASDIYSYGILLWSIVTGRQPYAYAQSSLVRLRIPEGDRPLLDEIRVQALGRAGLTELMKLMERCWDKKPDQRPSSLECTTQTEELYKLHKHAINDAVHQVLKKLDQRKEETVIEQIGRVHITQPLAGERFEAVNVYDNAPTGGPPIQRQFSSPDTFLCHPAPGFQIQLCNVTGLQHGNNNTMNIEFIDPSDRKRHPTAPSRVDLPPPHPGSWKDKTGGV